jgi:cytochrome c-type biogenesis protein CcmE
VRAATTRPIEPAWLQTRAEADYISREPFAMERNRRFIIGACIIVAAVSYLVYTGIRETSVYYLTIDEFLSRREAVAGVPLRVAGRVGDKSIDWNPSTLDLRFRLANFEATDGVDVRYNGVLPDMFAEGRDVIVEGTYGRGGSFHAHTLLTACPSKYEAEIPHD